MAILEGVLSVIAMVGALLLIWGTPEVPRSFQRIVNGRQPIIRVGWAIVRPTR